MPEGAALTVTKESDGSVTATGGLHGAGIGGGYEGSGGTVTVKRPENGAQRHRSAGIGGGDQGSGGTVTVNGGTVTVTEYNYGGAAGSAARLRA